MKYSEVSVSQKKNLKITFKGDTKRIKIPESYEHLVALARVAFVSKSGNNNGD